MDPDTREKITKVYIKHLPFCNEYDIPLSKMEPAIKANISRVALIHLIEYIKIIPLDELIYLKKNFQNYIK